MKCTLAAPAENSQVLTTKTACEELSQSSGCKIAANLSTKVREELSDCSGCRIATFKCKSGARSAFRYGSGQSCMRSAFPQQLQLRLRSRKCLRAQVARSDSSSPNIATESNVRKVHSRISSSISQLASAEVVRPVHFCNSSRQPSCAAELHADRAKRG